MKSITIHNLDEDLARNIRQKARRQGTSLNKTIKELLRESLGISGKKRAYADFSEFFGVWSKQEAKKIESALEDSERIDPEDWQ